MSSRFNHIRILIKRSREFLHGANLLISRQNILKRGGLSLIIVFFISVGTAQNETYDYTPSDEVFFEPEWILTGETGVSFPAEDYARAGLSQPNAGYTAPGYYLAAGVEFYGRYDVGFFFKGIYNENRLREDAYLEAISQLNRPNEIDYIESGSIFELSLISGLALKAKIEDQFEIAARVGAGISYSQMPAIIFPLYEVQSGEEYRVFSEADRVDGYIGTAELTFSYRLSEEVSLFLAPRYMTARFQHDNITRRITRLRDNAQYTDSYDSTKKLRIIHVGVGVMFNL